MFLNQYVCAFVNMYERVCVCLCVSVCEDVFLCVYMQLCICPCVRACVGVCVYLCVCSFAYVREREREFTHTKFLALRLISTPSPLLLPLMHTRRTTNQYMTC